MIHVSYKEKPYLREISNDKKLIDNKNRDKLR